MFQKNYNKNHQIHFIMIFFKQLTSLNSNNNINKLVILNNLKIYSNKNLSKYKRIIAVKSMQILIIQLFKILIINSKKKSLHPHI